MGITVVITITTVMTSQPAVISNYYQNPLPEFNPQLYPFIV